LRKIAEVGAGIAAELDLLRGNAPARAVRGADSFAADSLSVALDQAAAAAHDLRTSATTAAGIADRLPPPRSADL
jgi:hypothetical protein